jgi:cytoskeletal protein RodZ
VFEIGNSLREARLRRHIEFVDAEHGTKIRGKYLRALEDERFELLPSHTYIKGFLRSYADYLGLDGQLYVDEYNSRFVIGEEDAPVRARRVPAAKARRSDRRESNIVLLALTAIGLVTALVIVAWRFGSPEDEPVHGLTTGVTTQRPAATPRSQTAGTARLELRATRGNSYLIVKRGSALGQANILYQGTLERGQKQRFEGQVLWIRLESPRNVVIRRNGNKVRLPAAIKVQGVFVTAKKIFAADAA